MHAGTPHRSVSDTVSRDALAGLGTLVDEAAFDLGRWQAVLDEMARVLPGTRVLFQVIDPALGRAAPMLASGWDGWILSDYAAHYGAINPWVPVLLRAPALTTVFSDAELAPSAFRASPFYQEWLRHIGEADASTGTKLIDRGGRLGAITLSYDGRHAARVNAGAARVLDALAPRMRRALDIGRTGAAAAWRSQATPVLAALSDPALIVTRDGGLVEANAAAEILIADGVFRVGAGDAVRFADPGLAQDFAEGVRAACGAPGPARDGLAPRGPDARHALTVLGLSPDMLRTRSPAALLAAGALALVVIRPRGGPDLAGRLARSGLSPAEIRLALAMDGSRPLRAVADELGIAHETARTHLKRVFGKLGVARQSELVALLIRLAAER
ncbi:helix-turn-helix transcriptional regulator [Methylobacterium sp. NEAU 140]|uniref:helix-turn-helix transcriptional regulator n=1 Tax=Methylobacterium sp. NEAU 140 TaxID=3064945 RepID=UPI00273478BD|nr:helix-turn-helix transcriptional regulator [Methylobacterium sp. NEAU 140]MDP4022801.1 helix-turn-helix transcriptional regulator [Methylobacterium sp. NEAU 140]